MTALPAPGQPGNRRPRRVTPAQAALLRHLASVVDRCNAITAAANARDGDGSTSPVAGPARPSQDAPAGPVAPLGTDPRQGRAAD